MNFEINIIPYTLRFKQPAGTSRGIYTEHKVWYIILTSPDSKNWGVGECAPLVGLSPEYNDEYESLLQKCCNDFATSGKIDVDALRAYPSILFGLETALQHFERNSFILSDTPFTKGTNGMPINGLIWMGERSFMQQQIDEKLKQGFRCIKLKIGAIDFDQELDLLKYIRKKTDKDKLCLRVDANGAFAPEEAYDKLSELAKYDIHSIEQPIKAGQWNDMAKLSAKNIVPIALDEELIGINLRSDKQRLLETINPQYIILKPSLHGGLNGCEEWIKIAQSLNIGWWITSALESNIGLNSIAQWASKFDNPMPNGLGTGSLYTNNLKMPLIIKRDCLWFDPFGRKLSLNELYACLNLI